MRSTLLLLSLVLASSLKNPPPTTKHVPRWAATTSPATSRRELFRAGLVVTSLPIFQPILPSFADDSSGETPEEMIQRRARELQKRSDLEDQTMRSAARGASGLGQSDYGGGKTIYDFDVMINGKAVPFSDAVGVKRGTKKVVKVTPPVEEGGDPVEVEVTEDYEERPGAILLVNIKQDDPMARKNIPQLIQLAGKYGVKVRGAYLTCRYSWLLMNYY